MNDVVGQSVNLERESVACGYCGGTELREVCRVQDKYHVDDHPFVIVRCRKCGLSFVNPRPVEEAIGDFYPNTYYDAEVYHEEVELVEQRRLADIGRFVSGGTVFDIGCGNGRFLHYAGKAGWKTIGVEMSESAVDCARTRYGVDITRGTLSDVKLEDGSIDVATMWGVIEHLHRPMEALREVARMLRPGGLYVALVPNIVSTQFKLFGPNWYLLDVPRHLYHFNEKTLAAMAAEVGLKQVYCRRFSPDHDIPNLTTSLETMLYGEARKTPAGWTPGRIAMGVCRKLAPVVGKLMAVGHGSAAIESYFVKTEGSR